MRRFVAPARRRQTRIAPPAFFPSPCSPLCAVLVPPNNMNSPYPVRRSLASTALRHCVALAGLFTASVVAHSQTVGYWRLESPDTLADSGPFGLHLALTGSTATSHMLPASGAGSSFPTTVARTGLPDDFCVRGSAANNSFGSSNYTVGDAPAFSISSSEGITVEAFVNLTAGSSATKHIAAQGSGQTDGSWGFGVSGDGSGLGARRLFFQFRTTAGGWGATGIHTINSNVEIVPGKDYYVAAAIKLSDTSATGAVFYIRNLTDNTALQTVSVARSSAATALHDTALAFTIGNSVTSAPWLGLIDEVRVSKAQLPPSKLLIASRNPGPADPEHLFGINVSAAEFASFSNAAATIPGVYGQTYFYPTAAAMDYYQAKGFRLIRFPFRWERIQSSLGGPLNSVEMRRMDAVMQMAADRGMKVVFDMHNFSDYYIAGVKHKIGMPGSAATAAHFTDVWRKLVRHYQAIPEFSEIIYAYDVMNEPTYYNGDPTTVTVWPALAQQVVDAIRETDSVSYIMISGDGYSQATNWELYNEGLNVADPSDRIIYQAHTYFDKSRGGFYNLGGYDAEQAYPEVALDRVRPFIDWLQKKNARGFVGEYGVPRDDARWLTVLDKLLVYLKDNGVSGTYWCAGPNTVNNQLSCEPANGVDRPQMAVLTARLEGNGGVGVGTGLRAFYHSAYNLTGTVVTTVDPTINLNLGTSPPPGTGFGASWSARWIGKVKAPATGTYTFYANSDDGVRVWVNGKLVASGWTTRTAPVEVSGTVKLYQGIKYDIRVEYYKVSGDAVCQLRWSGPGLAKQIIPAAQFYPIGDGLRATYYDVETLSGTPLYRIESQIFKPWYGRSPLPGMGSTSFSVRWEGCFSVPTSGTYRLTTTTDDGVRLWFNGTQYVNNWTTAGAARNNALTVTLSAGAFYPLTIEYYHLNAAPDSSRAFLLWQPVVGGTPSGPAINVPEEWLYSASPGVSPGAHMNW